MKHVKWFRQPKAGSFITTAIPLGEIEIQEDGSIVVAPEDGHYTGKISAEQACELAYAILEAARKELADT